MFYWLIFALPGLILGLWAQARVKRAFNKYSKVPTMRGITGAQVARVLLDEQGLSHVAIEETQGRLSDHYDPRSQVLRLSPDVYRTPSIAAAGVAAHEMGHALQDEAHYVPLKFRSCAGAGNTVYQQTCTYPIYGRLSLDFNCQFGNWAVYRLGRCRFVRHRRNFHPGDLAGRIQRQ